MEVMLTILTSFITFVCGLIAKRIPWFHNYLIPVQNIMIGIFTALIYYIYSKNISYSIMCAGLFSGGLYDLFNNLNKIINTKESIDKNECQNDDVNKEDQG